MNFMELLQGQAYWLALKSNLRGLMETEEIVSTEKYLSSITTDSALLLYYRTVMFDPEKRVGDSFKNVVPTVC